MVLPHVLNDILGFFNLKKKNVLGGEGLVLEALSIRNDASSEFIRNIHHEPEWLTFFSR